MEHFTDPVKVRVTAAFQEEPFIATLVTTTELFGQHWFVFHFDEVNKYPAFIPIDCVLMLEVLPLGNKPTQGSKLKLVK